MKKRIRSIDIAKGICILAIIIGHFGVPLIVRIVFTFHIPVFYIITGYFTKEEKLSTFAVKKAQGLLLPYLTTCVAVILLAGGKAVIFGKSPLESVWYWFRAGFYGAGSTYHLPDAFPAIGAIWFLLSAFWGSLFLQMSLRFKRTGQVLWVCSLFAFGYGTSHKLFWFPFSIQAGCCAAFFMYVGYYAGHCGDRIKSFVHKVRFLAFPVWLGFILTFTSFSMVCCDFGKGIPDILASCCAAYCIFMISGALDNMDGKISAFLAYCGRNSLIILCVHLTEMNLVDWWAVVRKFEYSGTGHLTGCVLAVALKMIVIMGFSRIIAGRPSALGKPGKSNN